MVDRFTCMSVLFSRYVYATRNVDDPHQKHGMMSFPKSSIFQLA